MILFEDKKLRQLFINFLKENGIYKSYITEKFRCEVYDNHVIHTNVFNDPKMYIMGAFIFANTRQGWTFWREMNKKWNQTLEKYLNKN